MTSQFIKQELINVIVCFLMLVLPTCIFASGNEYSSQFVNQSNQLKSHGFILVKTRTWPNSACLIDTGKQMVFPGESTTLKIKKDPKCNESGVGYSIYRVEDTKNQHLLGYVSHRFANGKFSVQISRFCEGDKCLFKDLNPEQNR